MEGKLLLQFIHGCDLLTCKLCDYIAFLQSCVRCGCAVVNLYDIDAFRHTVGLNDLVCHCDTGDSKITSLIIGYFVLCLFQHQFCNDRICRRDRDRIAHALDRASADLVRVDTDDLTLDIQQSAAGVTGVDRCICLDKCTVRTVGKLNASVQCTDNTGRHGLTIAKRVADRDRRLANGQGIGVAQCCYGDLAERTCINAV